MHDIGTLERVGTGKNGARRLVPVLFPFFFFLFAALPAPAQQTNLEVFQQLAVECLGGVPDTLTSFRLAPSENLPYVRPALTGRWQQEQRSVFLGAAGDGASHLPRLEYEISDARVEYLRLDRRNWTRRVTLGLQYSLTDRGGRLLVDDGCMRTFEDTIPAGIYETLELPLYPETQADPPAGRAIQRYVEPVVIGAAISVMAYLFFTVRSRSDSQ